MNTELTEVPEHEGYAPGDQIEGRRRSAGNHLKLRALMFFFSM